MMAVRLAAWGGAVLLLAGCSGPVGLYHDVEGGAIAEGRQPPPGAELPYPNLASVPAPRTAPSGAAEAAARAQVAGMAPAGGVADVTAPSDAALADLALPAGPPPAPDVPGLVEAPPAGSAPAMIPFKTTPVVAARQVGAPVELAFAPGSALLTAGTAAALSGVAAAAGSAGVLVGGFGDAAAPGDDAAMRLALARARRLADALTAAGVPAGQIRLVAAAAGAGGFVQLDY